MLTLAIWHSTLRDYMQVQVQVQCFLEINVFLVFVQFLGFTMLVKYINISMHFSSGMRNKLALLCSLIWHKLRKKFDIIHTNLGYTFIKRVQVF